MKLILSIILAGLLGILVFFGPIGIYILCAIIVGVIFRSFVLLYEIHKQVVSKEGADRAKEAYERYLKEREEKEKKNDLWLAFAFNQAGFNKKGLGEYNWKTLIGNSTVIMNMVFYKQWMVQNLQTK